MFVELQRLTVEIERAVPASSDQGQTLVGLTSDRRIVIAFCVLDMFVC
jgi:hypothetical protein